MRPPRFDNRERSLSPAIASGRAGGESQYDRRSIRCCVEEAWCPLGLFQDLQSLRMQQAIADNHVWLQDAAGAVPGAVTTPGLLDDRLDGSHIPGVDPVFHHQLSGALGNEHEAIKV